MSVSTYACLKKKESEERTSRRDEGKEGREDGRRKSTEEGVARRFLQASFASFAPFFFV